MVCKVRHNGECHEWVGGRVYHRCKERSTELAAFVTGPRDEPKEDEFAGKGDEPTQAPQVNARATIVARPADVKALAEAALPQYVRKAGGTPQPQLEGLLPTVSPLPQVTVPFPQKEGGIVVLDLFSGVRTTVLGLLRTGVKIMEYYSVATNRVARQV